MYDCIIIGAGLSGLAAGIRLAHFNKKVCILEQHHRLGGLNSYFNRKSMKLETGLHAMTNYAEKKSAKSLPLNKILRQLRIPYDALTLREQNKSLISFPETTLEFSNDFEDFKQSVLDSFPAEADAFIKFNQFMQDYDALNLSSEYISARKVLKKYFKDSNLIDMLFCPLMYYGSAVEDDMDFSQFVIMYKSIFYEGFCRPGKAGIQTILSLLKERFLECGGDLRTKTQIQCIVSENDYVKGVETTTGEFIEAKGVLSTAGSVETYNLCDNKPPATINTDTGQLSFIEVIATVDQSLLKDHQFSIMFYNNHQDFIYKKPDEILNDGSGVICLPTNFNFEEDDFIPDPMVRVTAITNYDLWPDWNSEDYGSVKNELTKQILTNAETQLGLNNLHDSATFIDTMTPKTIERFTGHINGAVYGAPQKVKDGKTHLNNLFLCGTDQGFLGIVGSMLSGISIANLHLLK